MTQAVVLADQLLNLIPPVPPETRLMYPHLDLAPSAAQETVPKAVGGLASEKMPEGVGVPVGGLSSSPQTHLHHILASGWWAARLARGTLLVALHLAQHEPIALPTSLPMALPATATVSALQPLNRDPAPERAPLEVDDTQSSIGSYLFLHHLCNLLIRTLTNLLSATAPSPALEGLS